MQKVLGYTAQFAKVSFFSWLVHTCSCSICYAHFANCARTCHEKACFCNLCCNILFHHTFHHALVSDITYNESIAYNQMELMMMLIVFFSTTLKLLSVMKKQDEPIEYVEETR